MSVDPAHAAAVRPHGGQAYYFCSNGCAERFSANPEQYAIVSRRRVHKDAVCGMDVSPSSAASAVEHDGRMYYFCSSACQQKFEADPKRFLSQAPELMGS